MLKFAVYNDASQQWMHIDINRWLLSMSEHTKNAVEKVIKKHIISVKQVFKSKNNMYRCLVPQ